MNHARPASTRNLLPNALLHMYMYVISLVKADRVRDEAGVSRA